MQSNTSTQAIWQVQVAGCVSRCQDLIQLQSAGQQNVTVQTGGGGPGLPTSSPPPSSAAGDASSGPSALSQLAATVTQIQAGCELQCYGAATLSAPGDPWPVAQLLSGLAAVQQLLSGPASLSQALSGPSGLQQLLAGLGLVQVAPSAAGGPVAQNTVEQTTYQVQTGAPGTAAQAQSAIQVNTTVQSWLPQGSAPDAASGAGPVGAAVNQGVQSIWQLQVGCIFYCVRTQQTQQATASNTLISPASPLVSTPGGGAGPTPSAPNTAVMRVWQLQIGCLFWCYDTPELQSAVLSANTITVPADVTPPATPAAGSGSTAAGSGAATSAGSAPAGGGDSPAAAAAGTPSSPSPGLMPAPSQGEISPPPESQNRISSRLPASAVGGGPPLVRGFAGATPQAAVVASGLEPGAGEKSGLPRPAASPATGGGKWGGAVRGSAERSASRTGRRNGEPGPSMTMVSPHVRQTAARAAVSRDVSPSPLLVVLGGAVCLFLLGLLVSASRGVTPGT